MTDKEIIKALECCCDEEVVHFCSKCPMYIQDKENDFCQEDLAKKALDLINRQNAEMKSLTEKLEVLGDPLQDAQYKIAEQQAEIERLTKIVEEQHEGSLIAMEVYKNEAIKGFWEKAKQTREFRTQPYVYIVDGDNLVKEMVGDVE